MAGQYLLGSAVITGARGVVTGGQVWLQKVHNSRYVYSVSHSFPLFISFISSLIQTVTFLPLVPFLIFWRIISLAQLILKINFVEYIEGFMGISYKECSLRNVSSFVNVCCSGSCVILPW